MTDITQSRVREVLDYNPETGSWTWRHRSGMSVQWLGHFAGRPAGGIDPDTGYLRIRVDDRLYYAHRLAFLYMTGEWPPEEADHKNLDRADCTWENLRPATHEQNGANKRARSDNTSGFKGVWYDKNGGRWTAELMICGRRLRKCGFASAELAYRQYQEWVAVYCGEHGRVA